MIELTIPAMSCQHCVNIITKTVHALDSKATLDFRLERHTVKVETMASPEQLQPALAEAGYSVTAIDVQPQRPGHSCDMCD